MSAFFGGYFNQVYQEGVVSILDSERWMARVPYTVDTGCIHVPDRIDTYIIRRGRIVALTVHGYVDFSC